jgi:hypothetical protein
MAPDPKLNVSGSRTATPVPAEQDGSTFRGRYSGEHLEDGTREGKGKYTWRDLVTYTGDWKAHFKHGKGVYVNEPDEIKYDGDWRNDLMHGVVSLFFVLCTTRACKHAHSFLDYEHLSISLSPF